MTNFKNYHSQQIPAGNQLLNNESRQPQKENAMLSDEIYTRQFVDIEIASSTSDNTALIPQIIVPTTDEKRILFYKMREISRDYSSFNSVSSKAFYQQALLMKNFEDDYTENVPFSCYFPHYQLMQHEHLRTYFTWRAQVRRGSIENTSTSYAFLYIYELLNGIGTTDPQDGLEKLMEFWITFRIYNTAIDKYMLEWLKDYHVYYSLPADFRSFAKNNNLQAFYPTVFGYESSKEESFDIYSAISKYDIKKSIFYNDNNAQLIADCFHFVLKRFREICIARKKRFEDFVFYPIDNESVWTPFSRALFYPVLQQPDRQVTISEKEIYTCHQNHWHYRTVILNDFGGQLISYIMKMIEASLRQATNFPYKLSVNSGKLDFRGLKALKIPVAEIVTTAVSEYYANATRKPVSVDAAILQKIRQEATATKEKLLVPEDDTHAVINDDVVETLSIQFSAADIWESFQLTLTPMEKEAVVIILLEQDIKEFAGKKGVLLEVLIDGINQKATDAIGDIILEVDDTVTVFCEYDENLRKMWRC